jgi:hypothetical protein
MQVSTAATAENTTGSTTTRLGPSVSMPKKMRLPPAMPTWTSSSRAATTQAARASGAQGSSGVSLRPARRNPRPIPRKLPSRTMLEK